MAVNMMPARLPTSQSIPIPISALILVLFLFTKSKPKTWLLIVHRVPNSRFT
jgi:hypothetical protein